MSRRILHIVDSLRYGGAAKQLLLLSNALVRDGWDVHIVTLGGHGGFERSFAAAGIPAVRIERRWSIDPLADITLARHVARLGPDVVHTWDTIPGQFGPMVARKDSRPRIIAGVYRIQRSTRSWEWLIQRRFARYVDHFVTNSETVRDWHVARGLSAERFAVIPSGIEHQSAIRGSTELADVNPQSEIASISRAQLLKELELPPDARLIGVLGRLAHDKRVKDLIWAADLLRVLHDNLRMLIIGDGPQREQLIRYARLASDLEHIRFLGERDDVDRILPHLDVLWDASENTGQSMAILEAMAAGVPVIASDTPCNRELIVENETGYLIPLYIRAGRAMRARVTDRVFGDKSLDARLRNAAQQWVDQQFNNDQLARLHLELYNVRGKSAPGCRSHTTGRDGGNYERR